MSNKKIKMNIALNQVPTPSLQKHAALYKPTELKLDKNLEALEKKIAFFKFALNEIKDIS